MRLHTHLLAGGALCAMIATIPLRRRTAAPRRILPRPKSSLPASAVRSSRHRGGKRNADQVVDSIVAEDIGKLPDVNVTEALQRVSGIQVGRDRGEGSGITIRGLSQVASTFNGRSGGSGRGVDLENIPAELIARVDVYKTPSADLVEGGIGGLINVVTRKPLDKKGFTLSG
ncbi:tonB-dependent receptor plug domain-containing protein [Ditylenchus destructor]|uniref:TonB-dependent receptor plug domain-containing protein n=1 Tax=Ditylenchus destructor TaxID=166010 RepID=A0AAD4MF94_9BILA|nr:tonB-dependent receptor plug domain-containing protein [Ditylenchus destructor]